MKRKVLAIVIAGVGAAITVAVVLTLVIRPGSSVESEVPVNPPKLLDSNNSPTIVRNPRRAGNLVVVHRVDRPAFSALLEYSSDGGRHWQPTALPLPAGLDRPFAPDAAFAPDGTLYVLYANLTGASNAPDNLWLARSTDGGHSLGAPTKVSGALGFQPRVVVDRAGTVHVTWVQATDVGLFRFGPPPNPVVASRSTDGGRSFSPPVQVSDPSRERVGAAVPVIDSDGRLVVLYEDFKGDARDFENLDGPTWDGRLSLVVTSSPDSGATFTTGTEVDSEVVATRRFVVFTPQFPSIAAGPRRELVVAWADGRRGDADVLLRRSVDGGASWAPAVTVNGDGRGSQYLPATAVAPDGRVDVVFLDRHRDPADVLADAYLASSEDGASSFASVRLSSRSFDSRVGLGTPFGGAEPGSRSALVSSNGGTVAVWTDTRLGNPDTGRQDIVAAVVRRGGSVWLVVTLSLLAGALGAMAVAFAARRAGRRNP